MNLVRRAYCSDARQPENKMKLIFISYETKINPEPEISHRFEKDNIKLFNASKLFFDNKNAIFWKNRLSQIPTEMWEKTFFTKLLLKHHVCTRCCSHSSKDMIMAFLKLNSIRTRDIPIILDPTNITLVAFQPHPKLVSYLS